jgi:hypothetical protein
VSSGDFLLICHDGRVVPVPSGVYVHNRPMTDTIDAPSLVRAMVTRPMPNLIMVSPAPRSETSPVLGRYLANLPARVRNQMVVKPSPEFLAGGPDRQAL